MKLRKLISQLLNDKSIDFEDEIAVTLFSARDIDMLVAGNDLSDYDKQTVIRNFHLDQSVEEGLCLSGLDRHIELVKGERKEELP